MEFSLHVPINSVSFGQVTIGILRELYNRKLSPCIFPIAQIDLSAFKIEQEFGTWLQDCINKSISTHSRKTPTIKLWHLETSLESFSEKQVLITFYELDSPTKFELNIAKNNSRVIVTNNYTARNFETLGLNNLSVVPLAFDSTHFKQTNKKYFQDDRITFNLVGKFERRKHHAKVIKAWAKKYGNNPKYSLQCAVYNPFFKPEDNASLFSSATEGKRYFNINFINFMAQNELYNEFLNSGDIVIAMSGAEGWGLGEFHSVGLGKHCVGLNAHGHKEWMTKENTVLINPSGKIEAYDGLFFQKGRAFNQGNIFDWDDDEFLDGCEKAIARFEADKINKAGLEIPTKFTNTALVDNVLRELEKC